MNHPNPLKLDIAERAEMRGAMHAFMDAHPLQQQRVVASHFLRFAVSVAGIVVLCGGTAFAAEQTLPNDLLYPLKVEVIEPVVSKGLSYSPASEARVNTTLVERRLKETESLIENKKLDATTAGELRKRIERHTDAAQASIAEIAQDGETLEALDLGSELGSVLDAHDTILESLSEEDSIGDDVAEDVTKQNTQTEQFSDDLASQLRNTPLEEKNKHAEEIGKEAEYEISEARKTLITILEQDTELAREVNMLIAEAQTAYESGKKETGDTAIARLHDALQSVQQIEIILEAQEE